MLAPSLLPVATGVARRTVTVALAVRREYRLEQIGTRARRSLDGLRMQVGRLGRRRFSSAMALGVIGEGQLFDGARTRAH